MVISAKNKIDPELLETIVVTRADVINRSL